MQINNYQYWKLISYIIIENHSLEKLFTQIKAKKNLFWVKHIVKSSDKFRVSGNKEINQ